MDILITSLILILTCWILIAIFLKKRKDCFLKSFNAICPIVKELTDIEHYMTGTEKDYFLDQIKSLSFLELYGKCQNRSFVKNDYEVSDVCTIIVEFANNTETFRTNHNKKVIKHLGSKHADYFSSRLSYPLNAQQRLAVLTDEDNTLVVSSAGSGKTSTIVGKTLYLLEKRNIQPNRILLITFTRKAASEMLSRLNVPGLRCLTFHKTAKEIITEFTGKHPNYADDFNFNVESAFRELLRSDKNFRQKLLDFMLFHLDEEEQHAFKSSIDYFAERAASDSRTLVPDYERIRFTKSNQEKRIFHYLYTLGIQFAYERQYEKDVRTSEHRQYKPDFTIAYKEGDHYKYLYFEHFAIDKDGKTPEWFENGKEYLEGISWKKKLHKDNGTNLVYTTSADFEDGTWRSKIDGFLKQYGIKVTRRSQEEIENALGLFNSNKTKPIVEVVTSFINLMKAGNYSLYSIKQEIDEKKDAKSLFIIQNLIEPVYNYYQNKLEKLSAMDFADTIKFATQICKKAKKERFDYILVDEFQDISKDKYEFLQALRYGNPAAKLFCVGDDWQSIYRFAGSDMALFFDFPNYFGYTEERKIESTYRFGNPLISLSSSFILKNPNQKSKTVVSGNPNIETTFEFIEYESAKDSVFAEYEEVRKIVSSLPISSSIIILARYSFSDKMFPSENKIVEGEKVYYNIASHKCAFLTAHSSKGLEADYVIIIGCTSGTYGFPSRIANHKVLSYVMSKADDYLYSEERRLFYVAMTRAKKKTFFVYPSSGASEFIKELNPFKGENDICPLCGAGRMKLIKSGISKNGNEWNFYSCDNYVARCTHTQTKWLNNTIRFVLPNGKFIEVTKEEYNNGTFNKKFSEMMSNYNSTVVAAHYAPEDPSKKYINSPSYNNSDDLQDFELPF